MSGAGWVATCDYWPISSGHLAVPWAWTGAGPWSTQRDVESTTFRNAEFVVGDAQGLPFPNDHFDGARADRTLQHVDDPRAALKEMLRVVRPGGRIVVTEPDWGSLVIDTSDATAELELVRRLRDEKTRNGRIGRELVGHLVQLHLSEIVVHPFTLVLRRFEVAASILRLPDVAPRDVLDEMARRDEAGTFFAAVTGFTVGGVVNDRVGGNLP